MNQRIQDITSQSIITDTVNVAKQTQQMKNAQPIGGDSLAFYESDTGAAYDWSGTLPPSSSSTIGTNILFVDTKATTQNVLFADIIFEFYVGSPSNRYTAQNYLSDLKIGATTFLMYQVAQPLDINNKDKVRFGIVVQGDTSTTCYGKFYVVANDRVTITVTPYK